MEYNYIEYKPTLALADVKGSEKYNGINGRIIFKKKGEGVLVTAEIFGLPKEESICNYKVFAMHIHDGDSCIGNERDAFSNAGIHLNTENCKHPSHAGDMPPLFGNNGYAYMSFYTDRYEITDIIGKIVIIHSQADDFRSQPSGDSGEKIACGVIKVV